MADNKPTLGFLLHDVARLLRKRFEQHARDLGLTRAQWQVVAFLAPNEGIQQGALADLLEIEPITLVRTLDRMASRNLVERRQHPTDRRIWLLYLTPQSRALLTQMRTLGDRTRSEALAGLSDTERDRLLRSLSKMKSNLLEACARPVAGKKVKHG